MSILIALALLLSGASSGSCQSPSAPSRIQAKVAKSTTKDKHRTRTPIPTETSQPFPTHTTTETRQYTYNYYYPEKSSAPPIPFQIFTTVLLLAFTGGLWLTSHRQWRAIKRQGKIAALAQRPWIGAPEIQIEYISVDEVAFMFIFRNVGKTPTKGLRIDATFISGERETWESEIGQFCDEGKRAAKSDKSVFLHRASVPGSDYRIAKMVEGDFTAVKIDTINSFKKPCIGGYVLYGSQFDTLIHQTKFIAELKLRDGRFTDPNAYPIDPD